MTDFEIDVSGSDIFEKDYTILVAEKNNDKTMLGYKFPDRYREIIRSKQGKTYYRYSNSKKDKANIRVRLYCATLYYIFRELKRRYHLRDICLDICQDFDGKQNSIRNQLDYFIGQRLGLNIEMRFLKLPSDSIADKYAYLLRKDTLNKLEKFYVTIELDEFEVFLKY